MNLQGFTFALKRLFQAPHQKAMRAAWASFGSEYQADPNLVWFAKELAKLKPEDEKRTLPQNDKIQPMCRDIADQVTWYGRKMTADQWRGTLVGAYLGQVYIPNPLDETQPPVCLSRSSKELSKEQAGEFIEALYAFGASHGVQWTGAENGVEFKE